MRKFSARMQDQTAQISFLKNKENKVVCLLQQAIKSFYKLIDIKTILH